MNLILFSSFFEDKKVHDFILEKSKNRDPKICVIPSFTNFMVSHPQENIALL